MSGTAGGRKPSAGGGEDSSAAAAAPVAASTSARSAKESLFIEKPRETLKVKSSLLADLGLDSFPRSPWECRPGRSASSWTRPAEGDDAERRDRHSHGGPWERASVGSP